MRQFIKRALVFMMLLSIMVSITLIPAQAQTSSSVSTDSKRYNIMLVVDATGSLNSPKAGNTDPKGMRYELIGDLLGILEDNGHNIGAIAFSGVNASTPEGMEKSIMLNTGLMAVDSYAPDGSKPKDYLETKIRKIGVANGGATDIGTALLAAERQLKEAQDQNGMESLIFLFTDGCTSVSGHALEMSEKSRDQATLEMSQNGIRLFAVMLNNGGKNDTSEMAQIVCAANGVSPNSEEFSNSFAEVLDARTSHEAVTKFLKFLGYVQDENINIVYDNVHDTFEIPGVGVEEMNIRLYSAFGEDLPDLKVEIVQPDGTVISGVPMRSSRTFRVYKLVDPMPGTWQLDITVPKGNAIGYIYSPVLSFNVDAVLEVNPDPTTLHVNSSGEFTALLAQNGNVLTDPAAYRGYYCTLEITNVGTGNIDSYQIQPNANGSFVQDLLLTTYGSFEAKVVFTCGKIRVVSPVTVLDLFNREPTSTNSKSLKLKYGLFQDRETELDLTQFFSDPEDGTNLSYRISTADCDSDAIDLSGSSLIIRNSKVGKSTIVLSAQDSQGAEVTLTVYTTTSNATIPFVIGLILLLIAITVVVILLIQRSNRVRPDGQLLVRFDCQVGGKERNIEIELAVPGVTAESRITLNRLILQELNDDTKQIEAGLTAADVKDRLGEYTAELNRILVTKTTKRRGNKTLGAILVKQGNQKHVLLGSYMDLSVGDAIFSLEFRLPEDDGEDPFSKDDFFDVPPAKQKDKAVEDYFESFGSSDDKSF